MVALRSSSLSIYLLLLVGMLQPGARTALNCATADDVPLAGTAKRLEIADGVFMVFCYIPPGECNLGSEEAERTAVFARIKDHLNESFTNSDFLKLEGHSERKTVKTNGFWLGKYEVTQAEWKAVMDTNPSFFGVRKNVSKETKVDRLPVESVSIDDCQAFVSRVNRRPQVSATFGNSAKCVLPKENEWEYAYRGGKGNARPFYWGDALNGVQSNCNGNHPFGMDTKGPNIGHTCEVDYSNDGKYESHPWGLCHMSGNVWEHCENKKSDSKDVLCGGSWFDDAWNCRAVSRYRGGIGYLPLEGVGSVGIINVGFRVCVSSE